MDAYQALYGHFEELAALDHVRGILDWDRRVVMPAGGAEERARAQAAVARWRRARLADPRVGEWLEAVEPGSLAVEDRANLREMARLHRRAAAVPEGLTGALAEAAARAESAWAACRPAGDWAAFRPHLETVVERVREQAAALAETERVTRYGALLAGFQPGLTADRAEGLLGELEDFLPGLVARAEREGEAAPDPGGPFAADLQEDLARRVTGLLGYDFHHGRLDRAAHPFTGGAPADIRITTRFEERDFAPGLLAAVHEAGHALYEQHLPARWRHQPAGRARGMAVHEGQSLFMENQVGLHPGFLAQVDGMLAEARGADPDRRQGSGAALFRRLTRVAPGLIRVEADECTYPLHIRLRHLLEQRLVTGELAVADLPEAWEASMREHLGVAPEGDHGNGVMQDPHWAAGLFGYFPCYALGALIAAQLMEALRLDLPALDHQLAAGDLAPPRRWLAERVWARGSLEEFEALISDATGKPLDTGAFRRHLEARYLRGPG
ncbi:carboxypeptidase M32 [Thiohalorhabdus methylotrophus]|uniref:Metal-dependent carboxypeptidase n=1 Tax=Thiohalorhabdus methylotrophus TaxID=3242694 RepID=A0ABV4TTQ7_9GAMM